MKSAVILLLLAVGCGSKQSPAEEPQAPRPSRAAPYRLLGLPTGPRLFRDQKRCLKYLKTYAEGMEAGLGAGSSQGLSCEPQ